MQSSAARVRAPAVGNLCLCPAIPEIAEAARLLNEAVSAHLGGQARRVEELIRLADMPVIREWTEWIWGRSSRHLVEPAPLGVPPVLAKEHRAVDRMPTLAQKRALLDRDGFHCRYCGIPLIRPETRRRIRRRYPDALSWRRTNASQHAAFQAMWAQYDHVVPHSRGGSTELDNLVVSCAACNFGRMEYTLEQVGLRDPRERFPIRSAWDGLERFR